MSKPKAFERVIDAFHNAGLIVQMTGQEKASAQAPGHSTADRSVTITGVAGKTLVWCHSDPTEDVLAALGIHQRDLFDSPREMEYRYDNGRANRRYYEGTVKRFTQTSTKTPRELYKMSKVRAAVAAGRDVYVMEGEEDVRVMESLGVCATTAIQGAKSWHLTDYSPLVGISDVYVVADKDEDGLIRAAGLAAHLPTIGVNLAGIFVAKTGNDAADHIAAGYGLGDFVSYTVEPATAEIPMLQPRVVGRSLSLTRASNIKSTKQLFAWENFVPLGTVTTFAGRGGEGKSSFCLWLGSQIQAGNLPGDLYGKPGAMLIVGPEDDWATVMKPRLVAAGADLERVYKVAVDSVTDEHTRETVPALPLDIELIREAIQTTGAAIVMIDPITATIGGDLHKVSDVRSALDPLVSLAQETDTAIITIMHFNKGAGNVSDKLSGSHAFRDASRSVMLFATDEETGQRVVTLDKSNYSKASGDSFAFNLHSVTVDTDDGQQTEVAAVEYLGETDLSVNDIVNRGTDDGMESDRSEAERWIISHLEDAGGQAAARDILKAARADGLETQTVQRASRKVVEKSKSGFQGQWVWTLDLAKDVTKKSKI